jgi:hypothetical protein
MFQKPDISKDSLMQQGSTYAERSYWRRMGGGSLTISIIAHAILIVIAAIWIYDAYPKEAEPVVDFLPQSGGGGQPEKPAATKKRANMMPMDAARVAAVGVSSGFVLPEQSMDSTMTSVGDLSSGQLSGGLGGSGTGGGRGDGHGTGTGSGMGPGLGGNAAGMTPFGTLDLSGSGLVGVFYDTKQDPKGKPTNISDQGVRDLIAEFTSKGWNEKALSSKYYQAPQKLHQTRIYMPRISADSAPAAFNCKEVQARNWIVVYRGTVVPPKSGKFRFVGGSDDALVVRFNKKTVFDHGYTIGTVAMSMSNLLPILNGTSKGDVVEKAVRKAGVMRIPITYYEYDTTPNYNAAIGGLAVGPEIEVSAGSRYPIEILLSEIPGGHFSASLMIQETGVEYKKAANGSPILPIFRLDRTLPKDGGNDDAPPFDPDGPVWKVVADSKRI